MSTIRRARFAWWFFIGGALAPYGWRAPLLKQVGLFAPISSEGALMFNNPFSDHGMRDCVHHSMVSKPAIYDSNDNPVRA